MECTYGDRIHEDRHLRVQRLGRLLARAVSDGGKVLIPAFALGRTQELIYEMDRLFSDPILRGQFPELNRRPPIPVLLDTPLGLRLTEIYSRLSHYWDREARRLYHGGDHPLDFDHLYAVRNHEDHLRVLAMPGPAVIIAGSGMCTGGRIVNHLRSGLEDPRNDVLFVGYQAPGTTGAEILAAGRKGGGVVYLEGERVQLKARVQSLSGYSAHADQRGLMEWVQSMGRKPEKIKLVHGEPRPRSVFKQKLQALGYTVG
jgi:metallo-beta-lactamase family protein